ncbi:hypothetical protein D3C87_1158340 [compost metagenome]
MIERRHALRMTHRLGAGSCGAALLTLLLSGCQSSAPLQATPADAGWLTLSATMSQPVGGAPQISVAVADLPPPMRDARSLVLLAGGVEASGIRGATAMDFTYPSAFPSLDSSAKLRGILAADGRTVRLAEITLIRP